MNALIASEPLAAGLRRFAAFLLLLSAAVEKPDPELIELRLLIRESNAQLEGEGRWPKGIWTVTRAAKKLGVTRVHLSYVLHGQRQSRSLLRRYRALVKTNGAK